MRPSKEELQQLYHEENLSSRQIGKILGHHASTVLRWMEDYKIPRRDTSESMMVLSQKRDHGFLSFTPRITFHKQLWPIFRINKKSAVLDIIQQYQQELKEHGIQSDIYVVKDHNYAKGVGYILVMGKENVFKFLKLVDDFKEGEKWKQLCAQKMYKLAEYRQQFSSRR